ncbi:MAG: AAA family ATPase [Pseudomonadales bacterium]|nr:AAA family ATPase [Pseudomonadales bacterium]
MDIKSNCFILTGTSGTGKTTLLQHLSSLGFRTKNEATRKILTSQLAIDGLGLPSKDPLLFCQMMLKECIKGFKESEKVGTPVFFDRGIPDIVAYAIRFGVDPTSFQQAAVKYPFNAKVFLLPRWKEVFVNDDLRGKSFEEYAEFHSMLVTAYEDLGFNLIEVPPNSAESRADFVLARLKEC